MKTLLLSIYFTILLGTTLTAQVKIGNNPNTMNSNSILEMESTNKGFLPPRVELNNLDSVSPLSATITEGMTVYNIGNTHPKGYYYWNGIQWIVMHTAANSRTNYVLVKTASDFPAPVAGIINLVTGTIYEINGTITLTNKINLNACTLTGIDRNNDKLLYTPTTGELFTGAYGGFIYNLTLSAPGIGAKLFNIDGGGEISRVLLTEFVFILNCDNIGLIKGFGGFVEFQSVGYSNNTNGMVLQDISDFISINEYWVADNKNTYQSFVGAFSTIHILGGKKHVLSFYSAKAISITGITSISNNASLKNSIFVGDGTYVEGSFSGSWEVESLGLNTEKDDEAMGNIYVSTPIATTFASSFTAYKVKGTTTAATLFRLTSPLSNRLTYTGTKTKRFFVVCSLTGTQNSTNVVYAFYIVKNGSVLLSESKQVVKLVNSTDQQSVTISCTVSLSTNEYIELWVSNNTNTTALTVQSMNISAR